MRALRALRTLHVVSDGKRLILINGMWQEDKGRDNL